MKLLTIALTTALSLASLSGASKAAEFVPGQTLMGQVGGSMPTVQADFEVSGTGKLKMKLIDVGESLRARFTVRTGSGLVVKEWTAKPGKLFAKSIRIAAPGRYQLHIESLNGIAAYFVIETGGSVAGRTVSATLTPFNGQVTLSFDAVEGERIAVDFLPYNWDMSTHAGILGPDLRRPDGSLNSSLEYEPNYGNSILEAPIDQTGSWSVTYSGFTSSAEKVRLRVRRVTESAAYLY